MRFAGAIAVALLIAGSAFAAEIPQADRRSGYDFMKPDTKAMQDEDTANPGMLWVLDGEGLWKRKAGAANKACADCHDDARTSMKGVATRYPAFDKATGRPVDLEQRINSCRINHQQATPLPSRAASCWRSRPLSRGSRTAHQSKPAADPQLAPFIEKGARALHAAAGPAQSRLRQLP